MRYASSIGFLLAALVMTPMTVRDAHAAETPASDITVTAKSDGKHCLVRDVTIRCSEVAAYLRDTLKLPRETMVHLRAGRAASYQSVRNVMDIIEKSGFNHPVAYLTDAVADASEYALTCSYVDNRPDAEMESHAECAKRARGVLRVSEDHLARMSYVNGLASVVIDRRWYYVMRNGRSLAVLTYDNGPDDFSEGVTRSPVGDKVAYFDSAFQQVIGPKYNWGWPFEDGRALVCIGCKRGEPDAEGHSSVSGGLWGYIDRRGNEIVPVKLSQEEVRAR